MTGVWGTRLGRAAVVFGLMMALVAPAAAQAPQKGPDALTPPPVVDPKKVETTPVTPGAPATSAFAPDELTLSPVPVLTISGSSSWEDAYDKLVEAVRKADTELKRLGLTQAGQVFVMYNTSDDRGFDYEVQVPFSGTTTQKPAEPMKLGGSFAGKVLRFVHTGSFGDMDNTYEQIANYLDEKNIEQNDLYIERYRTDLLTASPEALEIEILVPLP
ncbi:MAG: GyrI-like domain-containing protein [Rhizobiales bacterium]|uniref:GyrI-like domain-containing protein n=1 Tax=Xanthobacter flavus TaxID=281 RepID=UPI001ACECD3F|nr:GyrI-like domain-containing protein [Hyphomicrobiales bacterium]